MAMHSMTGFGRGEAAAGGVQVTVELSAVNRKQLDVRVNLPRALVALESRVQKQIAGSVSRGGVTATVAVMWAETARRGAVSLDMERAAGYVEALRAAGQALQLDGDLGIEALLRLPDVMVCDEATRDSDRVWPALQTALRAAGRQLLAMRQAEGRTLEKDIRKRLDGLRKKAGRVATLAPTVTRHYRQVLEARIAAMHLKDGPGEDQVAREVALFADRCDIAEELVRLDSHFEQAGTLMAQRQPAGRALDFLCQEILREINTLGSKANDARLTRHVIDMKAALECIREQIQNVE